MLGKNDHARNSQEGTSNSLSYGDVAGNGAAFGVAAGVIIIGSVLGQKTWWGRILAWVPLRSVGVLGLGIYLFHPLVINVLKKAAIHFFGFRLFGWGLFTATLLVTYLIAVPCYIYLEKQFLRRPAKPVSQ